MSEWLSTYGWVFGYSGPQWSGEGRKESVLDFDIVKVKRGTRSPSKILFVKLS